jgi:hypothetical protein
MIYETKGLSLEQVDEMYTDKSVSAWRSAGWQPKATAHQPEREKGDQSSAEVLEEVGAEKIRV